MSRPRCLLLLTVLSVAACAVACGGSPSAAPVDHGSTGGGSSSTGSTTDSGGGGGGTITLTMESFTVAPGAEVYKCQNFANPFGGADAEVLQFESHMTKGSHHLLLFYKQNVAADGALEDCSGLEFAATPYSTQLPDDLVTFPDGVAALVPASTGLRLQSHYLNTTSQPITANVVMTFHLATPSTVTMHAGVLFVIEPKILVAPQSSQTVSHDCALPFDMSLTKAASHMHQHGTAFLATIGGETVYQTMTWDEPAPAFFDPPKAVKGGAPLHFECKFVNTSAQTLTFGESAQSNEMCIFGASFFPVPSDSTVTVGCP